ncbi:MAG TPA: UDP-glucose 4-epimerase GalE [Acetobacteraceae bacterium]|nr:UDP-glucose 4-epimerase GalE [Acetobacteraceae bacterium]
MPVLVTGGAGYIGSHFVLALLDRGEEAIVLDDLSAGSAALVPETARLVVGDVGDEALLADLFRRHRIDAVAHFAARIAPSESVRRPLFYYRENTAKSLALIEAASAAGIGHFLFSSTAAVYGEPERIPIAEEAPKQPVSPYGASKLMVERLLADASTAHGLRFAALRYFNVAGADPALRSGEASNHAGHLIKLAAEAALGKRPELTVHGTDYATPDGSCLRDYVHVSDVASAHIAALDHLRGGGASTALNIGYGHGSSVLEVIAAVKEISGRDFPVRIGPRRPGDPARLVAAAARIRETLGWQPRHDDLLAIVGHALAWEQRLDTA